MTDYGNTGTTSGTQGFGSRAITAMFDSRDAADKAVKSLLENGFRQDDVRLVPGHEMSRDTMSGDDLGASTSTHSHEGGFWSSLSEFFFPDEDRHGYAEGLSRGQFLVSVTTTDANHERAVDILDDEGTIDMDDREDEWRSQGWTGYAGAPAAGTSSATPAGLSGSRSDMDRDMSGAGTMGSGSAGTRPMGVKDKMGDGSGRMAGIDGDGLGLTRGAGSKAAATDRGTAGGLDGGFVGGDRSGQSSSTVGAGLSGHGRSEERTRTEATRGEDDTVIPLVEENLHVGKREVESGRVKVRSYVVERPVEEQVTLRREHVDVQRRPVDRAIAAGEDPFRERTVKLDERREEAVVSKDARVREEVSLRKDVQNEQRTVSDTVRRTEVEVDDQRSAGDKDQRRTS